MGMTGSWWRRSHHTSAKNAASVVADSAAIGNDSHPNRCPPEESANRNEAVATQKSNAPTMSGRNGPARRGGATCGTRNASTAARMPSGRLMRKIARHEMCSVR